MYRYVTAICFLVAVPAAEATVLYTDSGEVNGVLQYNSGALLGLIHGQSDSSLWFGMSFVLPAGQQYTSLGFDMGGAQTGAGTTTFAIFDSVNNMPNSQLDAVQVAMPSTFRLVSKLFSPSLVLNGGQTYYLIGETTANQVTWSGSTTGASGTQYFREIFPSQAIWYTNPGSLGAFDITTTPEPSAVMETLTGVGLLIFFWARKARVAKQGLVG